jgi:hypothetical protein
MVSAVSDSKVTSINATIANICFQVRQGYRSSDILLLSSSSDKTPGRDSRRFAARVARSFSGKVSASFSISTCVHGVDCFNGLPSISNTSTGPTDLRSFASFEASPTTTIAGRSLRMYFRAAS